MYFWIAKAHLFLGGMSFLLGVVNLIVNLTGRPLEPHDRFSRSECLQRGGHSLNVDGASQR